MSLKRILYIEDDPDIRLVVTMVLQARGMTIDSHPNSQSALDTAPQIPPDLILLDITMPQKNGFETLTELRGLKGYSNVPAVFLTARIDLNHAILEPFQPIAVITKPFEPAHFKTELDSIYQSFLSE